MTGSPLEPPRNGEGDRAQRGGGGSPNLQRPIVYRARKLRREQTLPEKLLWRALRGRPLGLKFRRQHPVGPYVVDFCCLSARIVIEVDGKAHDVEDGPESDRKRDAYLKQHGFRVLRVSAQRVLADVEGTAEAIVTRAASPLHRPADGPPPRAGEAA